MSNSKKVVLGELGELDVELFRKWADECTCWDYACPQFMAQQAIAQIAALEAALAALREGISGQNNQ